MFCVPSGKTTLLNVLSGRVAGTVSGDILVNDEPLNPRKFKMFVSLSHYSDFLRQLPEGWQILSLKTIFCLRL